MELRSSKGIPLIGASQKGVFLNLIFHLEISVFPLVFHLHTALCLQKLSRGNVDYIKPPHFHCLLINVPACGGGLNPAHYNMRKLQWTCPDVTFNTTETDVRPKV